MPQHGRCLRDRAYRSPSATCHIGPGSAGRVGHETDFQSTVTSCDECGGPAQASGHAAARSLLKGSSVSLSTRNLSRQSGQRRSCRARDRFPKCLTSCDECGNPQSMQPVKVRHSANQTRGRDGGAARTTYKSGAKSVALDPDGGDRAAVCRAACAGKPQSMLRDRVYCSPRATQALPAPARPALCVPKNARKMKLPLKSSKRDLGDYHPKARGGRGRSGGEGEGGGKEVSRRIGRGSGKRELHHTRWRQRRKLVRWVKGPREVGEAVF
jgi:hypothetical protein